jgi:uncharacterized protein
MLKYDLTDLGYEYKGAATTKSYKHEVLGWEITDIPVDITKETVEREITNFLNKICALEIPTSYQCNLRCKYCYIDDPRLKNKKVSKESVTKILVDSEQMLPKFNKDSVTKNNRAHFSPWGAEPFMNIDTLEAIYEYAHETYGEDKYIIGTSTNGTIWSDRIKTFFQNLINDKGLKDIQVSLDGPEWVQDSNRPYVNGKGSFRDIENFVMNFYDLQNDLDIQKGLIHFCSTIHLQDKDFDKKWEAAAEFFSEPNQWWTSLPSLPMRMSGEDMYGEDEINRFVNAQKLALEVIKKRADQDITVVDFYTQKLFGNVDCRSKNAFPFCSAMNSQIGVDIEGSLYPCHGAMTQPKFKPWLWFGNLFNKTIHYTKLIRNIHYQFNSWNRGKCTTCEIYHYTSGSVCWSCAPHNLSVSGEPSMDNIMKCKAYAESFPYWVEAAKMNIDNPILDEIEPHNIKQSKNRLESINNGMHFDRNYDGIIASSVEKICNCDIDINNMYYNDTWWTYDNFITET